MKARMRRKKARVVLAVAAMLGVSGGYMVANAGTAHATGMSYCGRSTAAGMVRPHYCTP